MSKRNIIFDSQVLNSVQACAMKTYLGFGLKLQPPTTAKPLEEGDLLHKMFEFYYNKMKELKGNFQDNFDDVVEEAVALGERHAVDQNLTPHEAGEVIHQFKENTAHFRNDGIEVIEVEKPFMVHLYEDDNLGIYYTGKIDLIASVPGFGEEVVIDHKKAARTQAPDPLSNQFTGYCFHEDTELLTLGGWKKIPTVSMEDSVAQFNDGKIEFVKPTELVQFDIDGNLVSFRGRINQLVTENHRVLCKSATSGKLKVYRADEFPSNSGNNRFIVAGIKEGGIKPDRNFLRYLVAIQADGHIVKNKEGIIKFGFNRHEKFYRLKGILESLEINYNLHNSTSNTYSIYIPKNDLNLEAIKILGPEKDFGSWLLEYDYETLSIFIDELEFWDGSDRGDRGILYSTNNKNNAEWVQTIAALVGRYASIGIVQSSSSKLNYRVNITRYDAVSGQHNAKELIPFKGKVYCVNVPSSFLMTRLDGKIVMSGNSFATGIKTVLINKVGFQKTLSRADRFRRYPLFYTEYNWKRWQANTIWWGQQYDFYIQTGTWPENRTSCDKYAGCIFQPVCAASSDAAREYIIESQFVVGEDWDPTNVLAR